MTTWLQAIKKERAGGGTRIAIDEAQALHSNGQHRKQSLSGRLGWRYISNKREENSEERQTVLKEEVVVERICHSAVTSSDLVAIRGVSFKGLTCVDIDSMDLNKWLDSFPKHAL